MSDGRGMYGRYYGLGNVGGKDERTAKRAHNVGNGVLTDSWVLTGLADRFLFMTSLLPKEVYCCSRGNIDFLSCFPHLAPVPAPAPASTPTRCIPGILFEC